MKDEIMKFPSELIQKELAKDPAKLLNSLNNVKEIPSKKNNNIEQNTEEEKKDEKNMLSIISNSKEKTKLISISMILKKTVFYKKVITKTKMKKIT